MGADMTNEIAKYIDLETALSRVRGNKAIYKKMLVLFQSSGEFASLEETLVQSDYERAAEVAHGIKGMTGNLGLTKLFETSTNLLQTLRQGVLDADTLAAYRSAYEETKKCVDYLVLNIETM